MNKKEKICTISGSTSVSDNDSSLKNVIGAPLPGVQSMPLAQKINRFLRLKFTAAHALLRWRMMYQYFKNRMYYSAVAHPDKIIWVMHKEIKFKLKGEKTNWNGTGPGKILKSFEGKRIREFSEDIQEEQLKYKAISEHFGKALPWGQTELFTNYYKAKFNAAGKVLDCSTMDELVKRYDSQIDALYHDMKANGFRLPSKDQPQISFIFVHISAQGEIIYTEDGNHRLAIAKYLGIESIPCKVWWRHEKWQQIRQNIAQSSIFKISAEHPELIDHPDLQDLIASKSPRKTLTVR